MSAPGPDRAAQRALVERFVRERPASLLHDAATSSVLDVSSGKALTLDWSRIAAVEERSDARTLRPYLALRRDDGLELALADAGVVFAPSTAATGPLEGLPAAVRLADLAAAEARIEHALHAHPDEPPDRGVVSLLLLGLAILDGARAVGFEVSAEERRFERLLAELEARRRG